MEENSLQRFYTQQHIESVAERIAERDNVAELCKELNIRPETGMDLVQQALYDVVFLIDDSGSIRHFKLVPELKAILKVAALAASLFDNDGFSVRFLNSELKGDGIRSEKDAIDLIDRVSFNGETPLVGALKNKILIPMVESIKNMNKPLHVIIITDGAVSRLSSRFHNYIYP